MKEPPAPQELWDLAALAGLTAKDLLNTKSKAFKNLELDADSLDQEQAAQLISDNPRIMCRPLTTDGKKMVVGFDTTELAELLSG